MSAFDHIKKGALHHDLGIPEGEPIPGGKKKMRELCHNSIGDNVMIGNHQVTITPKIKQRSCWALNFGHYK